MCVCPCTATTDLLILTFQWQPWEQLIQSYSKAPWTRVTLLPHTHSQVKCMGTHIKWVCLVCKYAHTRHMNAHSRCKYKQCTASPVKQMCALFLASSVIPSLTRNISFIQALWDVTRLEIWLPPSCQLICLYLSGLDSITLFVSIGLSVFCTCNALQTKSLLINAAGCFMPVTYAATVGSSLTGSDQTWHCMRKRQFIEGYIC